VMQV